MIRRPPRSTLFPYTTALPISCRSAHATQAAIEADGAGLREQLADLVRRAELRVARFGGSANGDVTARHRVDGKPRAAGLARQVRAGTSSAEGAASSGPECTCGARGPQRSGNAPMSRPSSEDGREDRRLGADTLSSEVHCPRGKGGEAEPWINRFAEPTASFASRELGRQRSSRGSQF